MFDFDPNQVSRTYPIARIVPLDILPFKTRPGEGFLVESAGRIVAWCKDREDAEQIAERHRKIPIIYQTKDLAY